MRYVAVMLIMIIITIIAMIIVVNVNQHDAAITSTVGFVVHPIYSGFSAPESGFTFNNNTRALSVTDTAVYKTGYYSINGSQWVSFTLSGTAYGTSPVWLTGTATKTLPSFGVGEHYIIIYSCKYNNGWNCSDNRWQLYVVNNNPATPPAASCNDGIKNQGEKGVDCGGPCAACSTGNTYYISPNGSDNNLGTKASPWFTLEKAWGAVSAGDTIYIRGGTYYYTNQQTLTSKSGTSGNYIKITGYPNEFPIFDFSNFRDDSGDFSGIRLASISYVYFNRFRITNMEQPRFPTHAYRGIWLRENVHDCTFEQVETDHIGGWGVALADNINNIVFLNCDSHHNQDPYSKEEPGNPDPGDNYGGSDGWQMGDGGVNNILFRGCRSWANSDDGWDTRVSPGLITWENSWAFWNGYIPETITTPSERRRGVNGLDGSWVHGGNGEGFKIAGEGSGTSKIIKNSLAFENWLAGFHPSPDSSPYGTTQIYNSVAYANWEGFSCDYENPSTLRNDISYYNLDDWKYVTPSGRSYSDHSYNSDDVTTVTNADFLSLDSSCMDDPRNADGSLPDCNFLHLASGSKLIDAGTDVGLPFNGRAPDLGAFER
jgi:hypothetical protein